MACLVCIPVNLPHFHQNTKWNICNQYSYQVGNQSTKENFFNTGNVEFSTSWKSLKIQNYLNLILAWSRLIIDKQAGAQIKSECSTSLLQQRTIENGAYKKHLNGFRQSFRVWSERQLLVRYPTDKSVNLFRFVRSSTCNPGQCSTITLIDESVKFLHIRNINQRTKLLKIKTKNGIAISEKRVTLQI